MASTGLANGRPIDNAFPAYHQLECDLAATATIAALPDTGGTISTPWLGTTQTFTAENVAFARFVAAYFTAWMANQEYAINGLKPQDDGLVLTQLLAFWNSAHNAGNTYGIQQRSTTSSRNDIISASAPCQGDFANEYYYVQMLVGDLGHQNTSVLTNGSLVINTGPKKSTRLISGAIGTSAPSAGSALKTALYGTGIAAAATVGLAAFVAHQRGTTTKRVLQGALRDSTKSLKNVASRARKLVRR